MVNFESNWYTDSWLEVNSWDLERLLKGRNLFENADSADKSATWVKNQVANVLDWNVPTQKQLRSLNRMVDNQENQKELDNELSHYRLVWFKRSAEDKIEALKSGEIKVNTLDISWLNETYEALKKDPDIIITDDIELLYRILNNEHDRAKLRFKIVQAKQNWGISDYSMQDIFYWIQEAKEKGIMVDDLEEMIFEEETV